jgi:polyisoprenoid-binding protein YceI
MLTRLLPTMLMFAAAAILVPCGLAQLPARPQHDAVVAQWQIDRTSSRVYVRVETATRFGHGHGVEGKLLPSTIDLAGRGELVFDMTTFVADTPAARATVGLQGNMSRSDAQKVNANMLGKDVLDVAQFPRAVFAIRTIQAADGQAAGDPGRYQFTGDFTLHGVSHALSFTATAEKTDRPGALRLRGSFTISQTAYRIQPYSALGGLVRVADDLTIWGDLILAPASR